MQCLLDFLSLVGLAIFIMVLVLVLWDVIFIMLFEALWYIAMTAIFFMLMSGALRAMKAFCRVFQFGRYKRC